MLSLRLAHSLSPPLSQEKKKKYNKYNNYVIIFHYNIFIYYNPKGYLSTQVYLTYENSTFNKLNI